MDAALLAGLGPFVDACADAAHALSEEPLRSRLDRIADAARDVGRAWSGSAHGYHANVFYKDLEKPPPGAVFSIEWGLDSDETVGDWREFDQQDVYREALRRAGEADPKDELRAVGDRCKRAFRELKDEALSTIDALLAARTDAALAELRGKIAALEEVDLDAANRSLGAMRAGIITRDTRALSLRGRIMPGHLSLLGQIDLAKAYSDACQQLVQLVRRLESYLKKRALMSGENSRTGAKDTKSVFIIYGRNTKACTEVERFLTAVALRPLTFDEARRRAGAHPSILDIVKLGVSSAQAVIALFTPDEWAVLDPALRIPTDRDSEKRRWQARPNVPFEAGLAIGLNPAGTILVTLGEVELPSDVAGIHHFRLSNDGTRRHGLLLLLKQLGCPVDDSASSFLEPAKSGDFTIQSPPEAKDPFES